MPDALQADAPAEFNEIVADLTTRAQAVAEELKTRVSETEKARRLPVENMERIREEGLLTVIQSKQCGGHELSMRAHLDVLSAIAEGCPATAWVLGVMHAHSWLMAHFPEQAQDDVYGQDHNTMISAVIGPRGKAVRQADGSYILNGFWPFGSGCQLSKWLLLGGYDGWLHKAEAVPVLAIALCGGAIGLGRAAVKEFKKNIEGKTVAYTEHVQTEWSSTHITLGKAASLIDAGELLLYRAADDTDRLAKKGEQMSMEMRGRIRMDCAHGVRLILEGADELFITGGAAGLSLRNPMQQVSRDLHATNMHGLLLLEPSAEVYGRILLGLEPNTIII